MRGVCNCGATDSHSAGLARPTISLCTLWSILGSSGGCTCGMRAGILQRLHSGIVPQLRTGTGEKNELTLYVDGPWGELYVNGQRVRYPEPFGAAKRVNLGGTLLESHGGQVAVLTGFYTGSERSGARTRYENFVGVNVRPRALDGLRILAAPLAPAGPAGPGDPAGPGSLRLLSRHSGERRP